MPFFVEAVLLTSSAALLLGSIYDLRTGEIPEKVSYGLAAAMLALSIACSAFTGDAAFLLQTLLMGTAFFLVGLLFFYTGQWGGGDVKLMAGIGGGMGFLHHADALPEGLIPYYVTFFINMGFLAFPYVLVYGIILGARNSGTAQAFSKNLRERKTWIVFALSVIPSITALYLNLEFLAILYMLIPPMAVAALYLKAVEVTALRQEVPVEKLREGDVVAKDLIVDGRKIAESRDIEGFSKEEIAEVRKLALEGKIPSTVTIKNGIKFAPVLFITYLTVIYLGNMIEILFSAFL